MAVPGDLRARRRTARPALLPPAERLSAQRGPGAGFDPVPPARRRDAGTHARGARRGRKLYRSEEHTSELQSLMRISYAVFCLKKKNKTQKVEQTNRKVKQHKDDNN